MRLDNFEEKVNQTILKRGNWNGFGVTHDICVEEKRWEILKNNLFNTSHFSTLKQYGRYILTHFDKETLRDMYALAVASKLKDTSGRSGYKEACKGIIQMKSLSDREFITNFIQSFKDKYPKRKAMVDELNKI